MPPEIIQAAAPAAPQIQVPSAGSPPAAPRGVADAPSRISSPAQEGCLSRMVRSFCDWIAEMFSCICNCGRNREAAQAARPEAAPLVPVSIGEMQNHYRTILAKFVEIRTQVQAIMRSNHPEVNPLPMPQALVLDMPEPALPLSHRAASEGRRVLLQEYKRTLFYILNNRAALRGEPIRNPDEHRISQERDPLPSESDARIREANADNAHGSLLQNLNLMRRSLRELSNELRQRRGLQDLPILRSEQYRRPQLGVQFGDIYSSERALHHRNEMLLSLSDMEQDLIQLRNDLAAAGH